MAFADLTQGWGHRALHEAVASHTLCDWQAGHMGPQHVIMPLALGARVMGGWSGPTVLGCPPMLMHLRK